MKKLKLQFKEVTFQGKRLDLKSLKAIGLKIKNSSVTLRTELRDGANVAFRALSMRPPNRILSQEPLNHVVIRQ